MKMSTKTRRIAATVLFTFLPATVSIPVMAQDDPITLQARARFKEGVDAFDKGKYEEARLSFLQAYTLKKHPSILLNLAQSSAKSGHPLEAAKYFQQFLKVATTATAQQRKDAETGLAEAYQKIARIDVIAPAGTEISLDDQGKVGTTPMDPLDVEPGQHTVKSPTQSVIVTATLGQKAEARLGPQAAPTPPAVGLVPATAPPATAEPPPSGRDTVTAKRTNLLSPPETMAPVYIGLTAAGAGLVSAVVFAAFKIDAQSKADTVANSIRAAAGDRGVPALGACSNPNAPELADDCNTLVDNNKKVDTNAAIANVSLVVMGVGLAVAGVWYLAGPKRDAPKPAPTTGRAPRAPLLTPYAGYGNVGLSLAGEF